MNKHPPLPHHPTKPYRSNHLRLSSTTHSQHSKPQIQRIILALESHIGQLKKILVGDLKQGSWVGRGRIEGSKSSLKGRMLKSNQSKNNVNARSIDERNSAQKAAVDIFEVRSSYLKSTGKSTNNILELYEHYKKYIEKPDKSTRIMASMEMSNTANSLEGQKQSLLKHSHSLNHKETNRNKEADQVYDTVISKLVDKSVKAGEGLIKQSGWRVSVNAGAVSRGRKQEEFKMVDKRSVLALQLLNRGCYNMANLAKMLHSKKYKLSKSKQLELQKKSTTHRKQSNQQNNSHLQNVQTTQKDLNNLKPIAQHKQNCPLKLTPQTKQPNNSKFSNQNSLKKSKEILQEREVGQNEANMVVNDVEGHLINVDGERDGQTRDGGQIIINGGFTEEIGISQPHPTELKIDRFTALNESPILIPKSTDFAKSKYYVQPIPNKASNGMPKSPLDTKSISLKSYSRIIEVDSLPFEL